MDDNIHDPISPQLPLNFPENAYNPSHEYELVSTSHFVEHVMIESPEVLNANTFSSIDIHPNGERLLAVSDRVCVYNTSSFHSEFLRQNPYLTISTSAISPKEQPTVARFSPCGFFIAVGLSDGSVSIYYQSNVSQSYPNLQRLMAQKYPAAQRQTAQLPIRLYRTTPASATTVTRGDSSNTNPTSIGAPTTMTATTTGVDDCQQDPLVQQQQQQQPQPTQPQQNSFDTDNQNGDLETLTLAYEFKPSISVISELCWSPDSTKLIVASTDTKVSIWSIPQPTIDAQTGFILSLSPWTPPQAGQVSRPQTSTPSLVPMDDGSTKENKGSSKHPELLGVCQGHQTWVVGLAYDPLGEYLASLDQFGVVIIWKWSPIETNSHNPNSNGVFKFHKILQSNRIYDANYKLLSLDQTVNFISSTLEVTNSDSKQSIGRIHWSPDGTSLIIVNGRNQVLTQQQHLAAQLGLLSTLHQCYVSLEYVRDSFRLRRQIVNGYSPSTAVRFNPRIFTAPIQTTLPEIDNYDGIYSLPQLPSPPPPPPPPPPLSGLNLPTIALDETTGTLVKYIGPNPDENHVHSNILTSAPIPTTDYRGDKRTGDKADKPICQQGKVTPQQTLNSLATQYLTHRAQNLPITSYNSVFAIGSFDGTVQIWSHNGSVPFLVIPAPEHEIPEPKLPQQQPFQQVADGCIQQEQQQPQEQQQNEQQQQQQQQQLTMSTTVDQSPSPQQGLAVSDLRWSNDGFCLYISYTTGVINVIRFGIYDFGYLVPDFAIRNQLIAHHIKFNEVSPYHSSFTSLSTNARILHHSNSASMMANLATLSAGLHQSQPQSSSFQQSSSTTGGGSNSGKFTTSSSTLTIPDPELIPVLGDFLSILTVGQAGIIGTALGNITNSFLHSFMLEYFNSNRHLHCSEHESGTSTPTSLIELQRQHQHTFSTKSSPTLYGNILMSWVEPLEKKTIYSFDNTTHHPQNANLLHSYISIICQYIYTTLQAVLYPTQLLQQQQHATMAMASTAKNLTALLSSLPPSSLLTTALRQTLPPPIPIATTRCIGRSQLITMATELVQLRAQRRGVTIGLDLQVFHDQHCELFNTNTPENLPEYQLRLKFYGDFIPHMAEQIQEAKQITIVRRKGGDRGPQQQQQQQQELHPATIPTTDASTIASTTTMGDGDEVNTELGVGATLLSTSNDNQQIPINQPTHNRQSQPFNPNSSARVAKIRSILLNRHNRKLQHQYQHPNHQHDESKNSSSMIDHNGNHLSTIARYQPQPQSKRSTLSLSSSSHLPPIKFKLHYGTHQPKSRRSESKLSMVSSLITRAMGYGPRSERMAEFLRHTDPKRHTNDITTLYNSNQQSNRATNPILDVAQWFETSLPVETAESNNHHLSNCAQFRSHPPSSDIHSNSSSDNNWSQFFPRFKLAEDDVKLTEATVAPAAAAVSIDTLTDALVQEFDADNDTNHCTTSVLAIAQLIALDNAQQLPSSSMSPIQDAPTVPLVPKTTTVMPTTKTNQSSSITALLSSPQPTPSPSLTQSPIVPRTHFKLTVSIGQLSQIPPAVCDLFPSRRDHQHELHSQDHLQSLSSPNTQFFPPTTTIATTPTATTPTTTTPNHLSTRTFSITAVNTANPPSTALSISQSTSLLFVQQLKYPTLCACLVGDFYLSILIGPPHSLIASQPTYHLFLLDLITLLPSPLYRLPGPPMALLLPQLPSPPSLLSTVRQPTLPQSQFPTPSSPQFSQPNHPQTCCLIFTTGISWLFDFSWAKPQFNSPTSSNPIISQYTSLLPPHTTPTATIPSKSPNLLINVNSTAVNNTQNSLTFLGSSNTNSTTESINQVLYISHYDTVYQFFPSGSIQIGQLPIHHSHLPVPPLNNGTIAINPNNSRVIPNKAALATPFFTLSLQHLLGVVDHCINNTSTLSILSTFGFLTRLLEQLSDHEQFLLTNRQVQMFLNETPYTQQIDHLSHPIVATPIKSLFECFGQTATMLETILLTQLTWQHPQQNLSDVAQQQHQQQQQVLFLLSPLPPLLRPALQALCTCFKAQLQHIAAGFFQPTDVVPKTQGTAQSRQTSVAQQFVFIFVALVQMVMNSFTHDVQVLMVRFRSEQQQQQEQQQQHQQHQQHQQRFKSIPVHHRSDQHHQLVLIIIHLLSIFAPLMGFIHTVYVNFDQPQYPHAVCNPRTPTHKQHQPQHHNPQSPEQQHHQQQQQPQQPQQPNISTPSANNQIQQDEQQQQQTPQQQFQAQMAAVQVQLASLLSTTLLKVAQLIALFDLEPSNITAGETVEISNFKIQLSPDERDVIFQVLQSCPDLPQVQPFLRSVLG